MSELRAIISKRVMTARKARGLSQSELAQQSGFKPSAIGHFEQGSRIPSVQNLLRLSDALGVSPLYLLGRATRVDGFIKPIIEPALSRSDHLSLRIRHACSRAVFTLWGASRGEEWAISDLNRAMAELMAFLVREQGRNFVDYLEKFGVTARELPTPPINKAA